jgi:diguanylate cyclase (GGDEF)-like protein
MKPDALIFGVAVLCDQNGVVLKIVHNEFGVNEESWLGKPFPQIVNLSSLHKALSFLVELRARGSLFGWELDILIHDKMQLVHCAGLALEENLLIMAARTQQDVNHLFDEMMRINNEYVNRLREVEKEQAEQARKQPGREISSYDDLTRLNNESVNLQRELTRKNVELEKLYADMQKLAITDGLTGLYNRRGFFELSQREVERAKRFDRAYSIIILDIDHFKAINDTHGHETGDQVLEKLAGRLSAELRKVDILGRYGGEEFSLLLPETNSAGASIVAERLRCCIADEPIETSQGFLNVTISVGLATLTVNTMTLEELLRRADQALYKAKESGRNCVCGDDE